MDIISDVDQVRPCYRPITATSMPTYVTSNRYPGLYEDNTDCIWEVLFDKQRVAKVTFIDLDIAEPELDSMVSIMIVCLLVTVINDCLN